MTEDEIKVGNVYAAKKPTAAGLFDDRLNDRQVLWMDSGRSVLQYDSPTVKNGSHYKRMAVDAFAKWAHQDVTSVMPRGGEWRRVAPTEEQIK